MKIVNEGGEKKERARDRERERGGLKLRCD